MAYQKPFVLLRARLASHRGRHGENFARMFPNMSQDREQRTKLTEVRRAELPRWKFLKRCHCRVLSCHGVTSYRSSSLKRTMITRFLSYFQFSRCYLFFKLCHVYLSFEATVKPSLLFLQKRFLQRRSILNEHLSTSIIIYVQRTRKRDLCIFYRYHGLPIVSPKHRDLTRSRSDLSSRNQSCWILSRENRTWIMKKILQGRWNRRVLTMSIIRLLKSSL